MIVGLPWQTWLLGAFAILPGLVLVLAFFRAHRPSSQSSEGRES